MLEIEMRATLPVIALVLVGGCSGGTETTPVPSVPSVLSSISVAVSPQSLQVGQFATARASGFDQAGAAIPTGTVSWTSSAPDVASIIPNGSITALAPGQTIITATAGGKSGQATLTVTAIPIASLTVTPSNATLIVGAVQRFNAIAKDAAGNSLSGRLVTWSSSDQAKVGVTAAGLATGLGAGTATITATSEGRSATAAVTVIAGAPTVSVGDWTSVGPHHIPRINGHVGSGKLQALAVFPGDPNVMYAGAGYRVGPYSRGGVFKTTNGGSSWSPANNGLTDRTINALWVDSTNSNVVLAATENDGIFRSDDGGQTWRHVASFAASRVLGGQIASASAFVTRDGKIIAGTAGGLAESGDQGNTWTLALATGSPVFSLATRGGMLVAGLQDGTVMTQPSAGAPWRSSRLVSASAVDWVAIDPANATTAYATQFGGLELISQTLDGGVTWNSLQLPAGSGVPQAVTAIGEYVYLVAGDLSHLLRTNDAGRTWTPVANVPNLDIHAVFATPGQSDILVASDQGLYRANAATGAWTDLSAGISASLLWTMSVRNSVIVTAPQDFAPLGSFDGGATWEELRVLTATEAGQTLINPGDPSYCYSYSGTAFQYSTDGCHTWRATTTAALVGTGPLSPSWAAQTRQLIAVDPGSPSTVYVASRAGVYKSTDFGITMNATNWPITSPAVIAVDPSDGKTIYVGSTSALYRTRDGGATWTTLTLGASGFPLSISVNPLNTQVLLVTTSISSQAGGGVLRSTDRGATFSRVNTGLSTVFNRTFDGTAFTVRFSENGIAALATNTGVYISTDVGDHWRDVRGSAVTTYFNDVAWDNGYLYAATFGQGVLRAPVTLAPAIAASVRR